MWQTTTSKKSAKSCNIVDIIPQGKATNGQPGYKYIVVTCFKYCISTTERVYCKFLWDNLGSHRKCSGKGMWSALYQQ